MRFPYKRFAVRPGPGRAERQLILRPVIPVHMLVGVQDVAYEALVDSGADFSIFHAEMGEAAGIQVRKGKPVSFVGIGGSRQVGYWHPMRLRVGAEPFSCNVVFAYKLNTPYGILGQQGFFARFQVAFDLEAGHADLLPRITKS